MNKKVELSIAITHLNQAKKILEDLAKETSWGKGKGDLLSYAEQVGKILSTDNNEAGIIPTSKKLF